MKSDTITSERLYSSKSATIEQNHFRVYNQTPESVFSDTINLNDVFEKVTKTSQKPFALFVMIATFALMFGSAYLMYELQPEFYAFNSSRLNSVGGFIFLAVASALLLFKFGFFIYNIFLYLRYKPIESVSDELLPTVTVIVPAYNEGKLVLDTLISLANSDYPAGKLQLLAVDDGSKDDTWEYMKQAKQQLGDRVSIYQQPENKGKRHALYRGFTIGTGEIFVTVDSDSIVKEDTLRNLVSPFVTNENCGAVAGNVRVLNKDKGILPKMLNVSFVMSFEFQRSVESKLGTVMCTPGALAAYRSSAVFECLPDWINQTFMGQPSDIGEDRAMTNMILKQGKEVLFQRNSYVLTDVPEKYSGLYKMFIRWDRSNVRENIMMSKFVFKNFREGNKAGARLLFVNQLLKIVMTYPFLLFMVFFIVTHPILFLSSTLFSILIMSTFPVLFYAKRYDLAEAFWAYSYSILYTFGLFWITPYAIATANKRGWLTRGLDQK